MGSKVEQSFCLSAPLNLVSKDLDAAEVIVVVVVVVVVVVIIVIIIIIITSIIYIRMELY